MNEKKNADSQLLQAGDLRHEAERRLHHKNVTLAVSMADRPRPAAPQFAERTDLDAARHAERRTLAPMQRPRRRRRNTATCSICCWRYSGVQMTTTQWHSDAEQPGRGLRRRRARVAAGRSTQGRGPRSRPAGGFSRLCTHTATFAHSATGYRWPIPWRPARSRSEGRSGGRCAGRGGHRRRRQREGALWRSSTSASRAAPDKLAAANLARQSEIAAREQAEKSFRGQHEEQLRQWARGACGDHADRTGTRRVRMTAAAVLGGSSENIYADQIDAGPRRHMRTSRAPAPRRRSGCAYKVFPQGRGTQARGDAGPSCHRHGQARYAR